MPQSREKTKDLGPDGAELPPEEGGGPISGTANRLEWSLGLGNIRDHGQGPIRGDDFRPALGIAADPETAVGIGFDDPVKDEGFPVGPKEKVAC